MNDSHDEQLPQAEIQPDEQLPQPEIRSDEQLPQPVIPPAAPAADVLELETIPPVAPPLPAVGREDFNWKYAVAAAVFGVVYIAMFVVGGVAGEFAFAGLEAIPFAILAVLAYAAVSAGDWARALTVSYWFILISGLGLFNLIFTGIALTSAPHAKLTQLELAARIGGTFLALVVCAGAGLVCFLPAIRRKAAEFINVDPHSFVHATALATCVAVALMFVIPLLVVREPPIISLIRSGAFLGMQDADDNLRATLYGLVWSVPASFLAVGYPSKRAFRDARERLGLLWPGWLQLVGVVVAIAALLFAARVLEVGITWLWTRLGWNVTDSDALVALFEFGAGPVAAVLVGLAAGLGEELVFRGVLQPRLGIVLPALMFTSVHAFQYNFDALLQVLLLGLTFGVIRKWTNTTTCVLIHGGYDCVLFFAMYLDKS